MRVKSRLIVRGKMVKQAITMFNAQIEYDTDRVYGVFNCSGQYGALPVEKTLPKWAGVGDKRAFTEFLGSQIKGLRGRLENNSMLGELVKEKILKVEPAQPQEAVERQKKEIQNTIDLFKSILDTIAA